MKTRFLNASEIFEFDLKMHCVEAGTHSTRRAKIFARRPGGHNILQRSSYRRMRMENGNREKNEASTSCLLLSSFFLVLVVARRLVRGKNHCLHIQIFHPFGLSALIAKWLMRLIRNEKVRCSSHRGGYHFAFLCFISSSVVNIYVVCTTYRTLSITAN